MNTFHVEDYQSDEEETDIEMQDNVETKKKENKSKDWVKEPYRICIEIFAH
jgi:hypothetical protein